MKEKHIRQVDIEWNKQKEENHRLNEMLLTGRWKGLTWRRGVTARLVLRGIINDKHRN